MGNLLQGCFLYRWALAIFAWFSRVADGSRVRRGISVCWESSKLAAFLHRCLSSGTVQIDESRTRRLLAGCNERLSGKSTSWVEFSDRKKGGQWIMVTYSDMFQFCMLIVAVISLVVKVCNSKKK